MKYLAAIVALLIAAPAFAEEATTQPATAWAETPATQPAAKPKAEEKRGKVVVNLKNAADVWVIFPKDLRPKDGKLTDEQVEGLKAWAKENKGKYNAEMKITTKKSKYSNSDPKHSTLEYSLNFKKDNLEVAATANVNTGDIKKVAPKGGDVTKILELSLKGEVTEIKVSGKDGNVSLIFMIADADIVGSSFVPSR